MKKNIERLDSGAYGGVTAKPLMPRRARFLAGCFYIHDLALIGGELHANSVGQNAVVRLDSAPRVIWWPRCIERNGKPVFGQNHIQLNSIAAGKNIESSFFSASTDKISARRPGHRNFPVDQRGVIFSGKTGEPVAFGLTRPHSARLYKKRLYVDNSGYGEFSMIEDGNPVVISKLPGWTRGLGIYRGVAFVGVSRVLPRFRQYAPGLDVDKSLCGVYAVDLKTGNVLGSMDWTYGNQIFAIEPIPRKMSLGFPAVVGRKKTLDEAGKLYYTFSL